MLKNVFKHEKLSKLLRSEIKRKEFPENRFYTAKYLMDKYGVSQATLTRALQPLYDDGLLYAVSGKGTFVAEAEGEDAGENNSDVNLYCIFSDVEMFNRDNNPTDWFVLRDIIAALAEAGRGMGWNVHLSPMKVDMEVFRAMLRQPGSVFIFTSYNMYEQLIECCIKEDRPYAVYSVHQAVSRNINQLWVDTREAVRKTTAYLIGRGHRNIAFFGDYRESSRHQGYCRALREAKISVPAEWSVFSSGRVEEAVVDSAKFIAANPEVTAVVCSSDLRAMGVVQAAERMGRKIPDFGVTGVDNIGEVFPGLPHLTTVDLMREQVGQELVEMVRKMIDGETAATIEISAKLVIGNTA